MKFGLSNLVADHKSFKHKRTVATVCPNRVLIKAPAIKEFALENATIERKFKPRKHTFTNLGGKKLSLNKKVNSLEELTKSLEVGEQRYSIVDR